MSIFNEGGAAACPLRECQCPERRIEPKDCN
jgi:hypothetical protein